MRPPHGEKQTTTLSNRLAPGDSGQTRRTAGTTPTHIDFVTVHQVALSVLPTLLARWLPNGRRKGHEYVALNPRRNDRHLGSFRINLSTGRWSDFATGDRGGDVVSLAAYLAGISQVEAARKLAEMLEVRS